MTKTGDKIPIKNLSDRHLLNILISMQKHAEEKRRNAKVLAEMLDVQFGHESFEHALFPYMVQEAESRGLSWRIDFASINFEQIPICGINRGKLESKIVEAIRSCINAHGPITPETAPSAAKRVIGIIKDHNRKVKEETEQRKKLCEAVI